MEPILTIEMVLVIGLLALTIILFVSEVVRVDVAALIVMTLLGLTIYLPGIDGLLSPQLLFSGLASNAVVLIIAVMIIGRGLDKTGVVEQIADRLQKVTVRTESRLIAMIGITVAGISSFMQNVGAAVLFLPAVSRLANQARIAVPRLAMPMGFCAIIGGTLTMVGSSPLIMLNDLVLGASGSVDVRTFDLFAVTPLGLLLVGTGVLYCMTLGRKLLPDDGAEAVVRGTGTARYLRRVLGIDAALREVEVYSESPFVGIEIEQLQNDYGIRIVASRFAGELLVSPPTNLLVPIAMSLAISVQADPALFALMVAIATSNSFMLPTHQVNALIMGPGGYRVADFIRVGTPLTVIFLLISTTYIYGLTL